MSAAIVAVFGIITLLALSLARDYRDEVEHARTEVDNVTRMLEKHGLETVRKTDQILQEAQRHLRPADMRVARGINEARRRELHALLKAELQSVPEVALIHITDTAGNPVYSSLDQIPHINIADREHFTRHKEDANAGLVISAPIVSRTTGKWTLILARRLNFEDGSFAGIVNATLDLDYFQQFYRSLNLGPHGVVALYDRQMRLAARFPAKPELMGKVIQLGVATYIGQGIRHGIYLTTSPIDGISRQIGFRQLEDLPLYVFAGVSEEDYLADWHRYVWQHGAIALTLSLLVIGFGILQRRAEAALLQSDEDLHTIADYTYDWEYWQGEDGRLLYTSPSCERVTGYTQAEFIANPQLIDDIILPEDRHLVHAHLSDIHQEDCGTLDFRIVTKQGETRWIAHGCRAVHTKDGSINGRRASNRDITERKLLEQEVKNERDFAETLIDTAQAIVLVLDREGRIVRFNHYLEALTGYRLEEVRGANWFATFLQEQDHEAMLRMFRKAIANTRTMGNVNAIVTKDGRKVLVEWYDKTLKDDAGNITGLLAIGQDVTEREKLAESQLLLKAAVEQSNSSIVVTDADGDIVFVNAGFRQASGYAPDEVMGRNPRLLKSGETPTEVYQQMWASITSGQPWSGELCNRKKNGELYWETVNISPIVDARGTITHYLAVKDDITLRKQAESALQEQKNFLSAILENEPECVKVLGSGGKLVQMNAAGLAMLETDSVEEANAHGLANFVVPEHRQAFLDLAHRVFSGETGVLEFQIEGRFGTRRWLETHATPLRDANGRISYLLGVTRDVTRRREAEERLTLSLRGADLAMTDWHIPSDRLTFGEGWIRLLGYQPDELPAQSVALANLIRSEDASLSRDALVRHLKGETPYFESEIRMRHKDGHWVWVLARGMAVERSANGRAVRVAGTGMDISARKQAESEVVRLSQWNELLLNSAGEGIYGVDRDGRCTFINPAALSILGYSKDEVIGQNQHVVFHHHHVDGTPYPAEECPIFQTLRDGVRREVEDAFVRKSGAMVPVQLTVTPMHENGQLMGVEVVFQDIARRKEMERELIRLATTDALTGMANRRHFIEQLELTLAQIKRFGKPASFLMVDIDHFKNINDTYGHATGDAVLRHFAELSALRLRRIDLLGRLGGEEFGILLPGTDPAGARQFAELFRSFIADTPAQTGMGKIGFTISIGIAECDPSDNSPDSVMARADAALYRAKEGGRNRVEAG